MSLPSELVKVPRTVEPGTDAMTAARLMERHNVGSLIVVEGKRPVGMVTDRDLALGVLEGELDPSERPVSEFMNDEIVTLGLDTSTSTAAELLRRHGIRRLPVVNAEGDLIGIVTADDLVQYMARELADLSFAIRREISQEGAIAGAESSVFGKE